VRIIGEILWFVIVVFFVGISVGQAAVALHYAGDAVLCGTVSGITGMAAWLIYRRWRGYFGPKQNKIA
jgi:hypothetical protein